MFIIQSVISTLPFDLFEEFVSWFASISYWLINQIETGQPKMSLTAIFESFEQQYIEAASEIKRDLRSFKSLKGGLQHYNSYIK